MTNPLLSTEKPVETKKCLLTGKDFVITDKDLEFYEKVSPVFDGQKYLIPRPKLCPEERQRRRLAFRNERKLYKRKCSATGKEIISNHKPESEYPVFMRDYWLSDSYNPSDYGIQFDFTKPFFEQFNTFQKKVPRIHIQQIPPLQNSDYANYVSNCRDCYLVFDSDFNEKCLYDTRIAYCKDTIDSSFCERCEQCFECVQCQKSQKLFYSTYCINCRDSWFLDSCIGCQDCLFCCNLTSKQYCFMNQQLTKDEYRAKMKQVFGDSDLGKRRQLFLDFSKKNIKKYIHGNQIENSTGDDLYNVRNVEQSFGMTECEDCAYCDLMNHSKNCYDVSSFGENASWIYETSTAGLNVNNCLFGQMNVNNASNLIYCDMIQSSHNCFGCISVKKGDHCVMNKSYSAHEYGELCGKIITHMQSTGEWGEYFPIEMSPFGYNETVAQEYFPMTEEEVTSHGWKWYDGENKNTYMGEYYSPLPIREYSEAIVGAEIAQKNIDAVLSGICRCEVSDKPFKIIRQELAFYIESGMNLPTKHPDVRHGERMSLRNPRTLHERSCDECSAKIITTYLSERPEKILCEECYRKHVY